MKRVAHRMRVASVVVASLLVAVVLAAAAATIALSARPGEWRVPVRVGLFGVGPTVDLGVARLARAAVHPLGAAILDGRTLVTRVGKLRLEATGDGLAMSCAPCLVRMPALGDEPLLLSSARATVRMRDDTVGGTIEAGAVRGRFSGRLDARSLALDATFDRAPIADWYALLGDAVPETRTAHIDGRVAFTATISLPDGAVAVAPAIDGFAVSGLGTERLAGRMPIVACGRAVGSATDPGRWLPRAVIAAEDRRFDEHPGYDLAELDAAWSRNANSAAVARGASTIPQQLARLLFVGGERSVTRKLRELLYAVEMERTLGRARILRLYLAVAPWGDGTCGAEAAARRWFGVGAAALSPAQAVWLAAMLHAPDTEAARWRARGGIDLARAQWVAHGMRGRSRPARAQLARTLAAMAGPGGEAARTVAVSRAR